MRLRNRLWNPEHETKPCKKQPRTAPNDPLCEGCPNHKDNHCKGLCPPLQWIDGNAETKEVIPSKPIFSHGIEQIDYNQVLSDFITDKQATDIDRLDTIRSIKDYRIRIIAASILAFVPQKEIGKIAHISQGRISKLYHAIKR
jgi:hypothetical protein